MISDNSLGDGVYFDIEDYAGFIRRALALMIDSAFLFAIGVGLWTGLNIIFWNAQSTNDPSQVFLFCGWHLRGFILCR